MIILGLNAYHADAAACLVVDGRLVAAVEEERLCRIKHWAGFPHRAVRCCLDQARLSLADVDHVAINRDPRANLLRKLAYGLYRRPRLPAVASRLRNAARVGNLAAAFRASFGAEADRLRASLHRVEHHRAHLASAFFVSPFDSAAVASVDGFGDFVSTMWGAGADARLEVRGKVCFPHSLGLLYLAGTQHLGFPRYGDEYKVMGLAAYGRPHWLGDFRRILHSREDGTFALDLAFFRHHSEGVAMTWENGPPEIGTVYSERFEALLGPARGPDDPIEERHRDLAASLQAAYEEAFFALLARLGEETGSDRLCLAGGCALNSVANGKIAERTKFRRVFVQPAAGDAGGAVGAAFAVWQETLGMPRGFVLASAALGPVFASAELRAAITERRAEVEAAGVSVREIADEDMLCRYVAERLVAGAVAGWFQGGMEWGPRALGNRSILCDPRRDDAKDLLNRKIKRREPFRPFAPSVLREAVADWFETDGDVPFMLQVFPVRPERRAQIPAVTHVDGSGRLQTVTAAANPLYYRLIHAFHALTGVPMLLNTSFNENEPIVCRPGEAMDCFLRTEMDMLVLGSFVLERLR